MLISAPLCWNVFASLIPLPKLNFNNQEKTLSKIENVALLSELIIIEELEEKIAPSGTWDVVAA